MKWTTGPRWMWPCLLLLIALCPCPVSAQQAPFGDSTVLPPPPGDEPPPPTPLRPSIAVPNTGPFAPPRAPSPSAENLWGFLQDWPRLPVVFFADKEIDIAKPHLKAALIGPAIFPNNSVSIVHPPTTALNWVGIPRIEIGWFLPPGCGYFAIGYRGFAVDGRQTATALDGVPYDLRTRLDLNEVTFDYGTLPYSFAPRCFMSGRIGMAAADVYFDNVAVSAPQTQDASNDYYGAGPHLRFDVWREFTLLPGLALFAQPDLMVLVGRVQQHYRESDLLVDGSTVAGSFFQRRTQTVPVFTLRAGLSYTPARLSHWRFLVGYEFENWWSVGQVPGQPSRGEFETNGVFLRAAATF